MIGTASGWMVSRRTSRKPNVTSRDCANGDRKFGEWAWRRHAVQRALNTSQIQTGPRTGRQGTALTHKRANAYVGQHIAGLPTGSDEITALPMGNDEYAELPEESDEDAAAELPMGSTVPYGSRADEDRQLDVVSVTIVIMIGLFVWAIWQGI
ncbi:hypothetical protein OH76DRAFT_264628 [Lentinus brumalis]|uniref:Uncharacterized protein n=1 Tax=Lentinus brumalis TaxID=2498619 RepID=A0A371DGP6_9APHY|nr:hypothetical protein OH76DRAFT_264628 [Polyporus brumalis]